MIETAEFGETLWLVKIVQGVKVDQKELRSQNSGVRMGGDKFAMRNTKNHKNGLKKVKMDYVTQTFLRVLVFFVAIVFSVAP